MKRIVKVADKLREPVEPLEFLNEADNTMSTDEGKEILQELAAVLEKHTELLALSAPQIGIKKRIFGIRFNDQIKYFINPIITKKSGSVISVETISCLPGKEILLARPEEISVVYYTSDFKYEDNKLMGLAARLFDQQVQLLDGILPDDLGLVSDIEAHGSLANATDEEMAQYAEIYKQFVAAKAKAYEAELGKDDSEDSKIYKKLKFYEDVINGRTQVVENNNSVPMNRAQRRASQKMAKKLSKMNRRK